MTDTQTLLPAYARSLGIRILRYENDLPVLTVDFGPNVEGRPGAFHGGATAGLLENAGYAALRSVLLREGRERLLHERASRSSPEETPPERPLQYLKRPSKHPEHY